MLNQSVWSEACWLRASPSRHSVPAPFPRCLLPCSFTVCLCCLYVIHFLYLLPQAHAHLSRPVSGADWMSWGWIPAESCKAAPSHARCTIKDHEGYPGTISSLSGITGLFWLTGKDSGVKSCFAVHVFEKVFGASWKMEAADEKCLILTKMQNRLSHIGR